MKIFILDDCPVTLKISTSVLKRGGYDVCSADSIWCLSEFREFNPDIALIDVNINGLHNGLTFVKANAKKHKTTKFVFHSSETPHCLQSYVEQSGAIGYIEKSEMCNELLNGIRKYI